MREIKFRAWDKYENKMRQVSTIDFTNEDLWLIVENNRIMSANLFEVELMRYTGIKDKNGVEVYEGDIIKYSSNVINKFYAVNEILREVEFKYGMYGIKGFEGGTHIPFGNILKCQYEVIGNIYENPNLLEEE